MADIRQHISPGRSGIPTKRSSWQVAKKKKFGARLQKGKRKRIPRIAGDDDAMTSFLIINPLTRLTTPEGGNIERELFMT